LTQRANRMGSGFDVGEESNWLAVQRSRVSP